MSLTTIYLTSFFFTHRKWLGYFSQTQFPSKVTFPQLTWSPQQWVSSSRSILTHMNSFCPAALKGHFHKDTPYNQIALDLTFKKKNGCSSLFPPGMGSGTTHRSGMQGFGYSPGMQRTGESPKLMETHTHIPPSQWSSCI